VSGGRHETGTVASCLETGLDGSLFFPEVLTLTDAVVRVVAIDLPADG
jgi:hypothetical protein